jgi:hypothetical protein
MSENKGDGGVHWKDRLPFMNLDSDFSVDELREIAIEAPMGMLTDRLRLGRAEELLKLQRDIEEYER